MLTHTSTFNETERPLQVMDLGMSAYQEVWDLQKALQARRISGDIGDRLLLVEHEPVYTLGKNAPRDNLLKPENKEMLKSVLTYHVVAGKFDAAAVMTAIEENNNAFVIKTVQGETLTAMMKDGKVMLKDANGNTSTVVMTDVEASNGLIHAIDTVVMPKK